MEQEMQKRGNEKFLCAVCEGIAASRIYDLPVAVGLHEGEGWTWVFNHDIDDDGEGWTWAFNHDIDDSFIPVVTIFQGKTTPYDPEVK